MQSFAVLPQPLTAATAAEPCLLHPEPTAQLIKHACQGQGFHSLPNAEVLLTSSARLLLSDPCEPPLVCQK